MAAVLFLIMIASVLRYARPALWLSGGIASALLSLAAAATLPIAVGLASGELPGAFGAAWLFCMSVLCGLGAFRAARDAWIPPERAPVPLAGPSRLGFYGDLFSVALEDRKERMGVSG